MNLPKPQDIKQFQTEVWRFYAEHAREMPWRHPDDEGVYDPYKIMVSELMLQQTQVTRVIPKYAEFITAFPDAKTLASAELGTVLAVWSGLGYNRRAKYLWQTAHEITQRFNGIMPSSLAELVTLLGIGKNTAAAICAYAYDVPVVFVETNIRTVYIHHFFKDSVDVKDRDIIALVTATLPVRDYRNWYYALMDYGAHIKATVGNLNKHAKAYQKQPTFKGSRRQLRGSILRSLASHPQTIVGLRTHILDERLADVVSELQAENLIHLHDGLIILG